MENDNIELQHHRRGEDDEQKRDSVFVIRNILNIIFMAGALAGVAVYLLSQDKTTGIYIVLVAMVFKMAECCLRFFHR